MMSMIIKYQIGSIGVYVENDTSKWYRRLKENLDQQLPDYQADNGVDHGSIEKKIIFRDFSSIQEGLIHKGVVDPGNSIFNDEIFIYSPFEMGFQLGENTITIWVDKVLRVNIPFIMSFLLIEENRMFVHGAAIAKDHKGILLLSFNGMGKTTFVSSALNCKGVKVLGDDLIIIDQEGFLYPYFKPVFLRPYHKKLFKSYFDENKPRFRRRNLCKRALNRVKRQLRLNYNPVSSHTAPPSKLFKSENIQMNKIKLDTIYVLKKYKELKDIQIETDCALDSTVNFSTSVIWYEWRAYVQMILNLLSLKDEDMAAFFQAYRNIAQGCFMKANNIVFLKIPDTMKSDELSERLIDIILR